MKLKTMTIVQSNKVLEGEYNLMLVNFANITGIFYL